MKQHLNRILPSSLWLVVFTLLQIDGSAQTAVNMSSQPGYVYTQNFSDINNWVFSTSPVNGTFTAGTGSSAWKGNVTNATGAIPDGVKLTTATTGFVTGTSGGVQKGSGSMVLLTTSSTENTTAVAMDLHLNFTSLSAGTVSFDWSTANNSTGNRKSSLKVFASINGGSSFAEITGAAVTNFTNNDSTYGSITNVNLPSTFNNVANAIIRFYIYNGTGGTTGSRPKISIDNVSVTAQALVSCSTPANQPTSISFSSIGSSSFQTSFMAAVSNPDNYLVLSSNSSSLSSLPVDGNTYSPGDNIGDASVVSVSNSSSITVGSLSPSTLYYLYIFSVNTNCSGGPLYQTTSPLTGSVSTTTNNSACTTPTTQASGLQFSNVLTNSLQGNFSTSNATDEWLVVRSTNATLSANPSNTVVYNAGDALGGGIVAARVSSGSFISNLLSASTTYYFFVFSINSQNCTGGPLYFTTSPLTGNITTAVASPCVTPVYQPTNLVLKGANTNISGSFSNVVDADSYLVLYSTSTSLSQSPVNNTNYTVGASLGNAIVASISSANHFYLNNLSASTQYYFYVFAKNSSCTGGTKYNTTSPLTGNRTTTATATYNFYYGNLHAHSRYSDGNKDNPTFTPADDYDYAKNSLGMDFLGLSEHNHAGAGMSLSNWPLGVSQAVAATNSSFVALYGQEWGVISGGGHALVYGIDSLIGWEANNYQVFVPKSDYIGTPSTTGTTGLFRTLNLQGNAFATFAHPNSNDFNNISNIDYNATADSAVIGTAIESGPAFSTNTTYNDNPSSMSFLSYYNKMLGKGYHIGPLMDHDTHYTNFGRANENRLVVLASTLSKSSLIGALKARRFYATQDIDTRVSFIVNSQPMGSIFAGNISPVIFATASDPSSPASVPLIKLMYGTPGSGVNPVQITSVNAYTLSYTDNSLPDGATGLYYLDITINGNRTITSPIWYTRNSCASDPDNPIVYWTGSSNSSINNASNWCGGVVPSAGSNIIISSSVPNMPVIIGGETLTVNNLTIEVGSSLSIGTGTLQLQGVVLNNGTLNASAGTVAYIGNTLQTTPTFSNHYVENLTLNNPEGLTLGDSTKISGVLTLTNGQLSTNNKLVLHSSATKDSRIAPITGGSISGEAIVERYMPLGKKAYRQLASGVNSTGSIYANWQNNGVGTAGTGMHITGSNTGANGFDATQSGSASMFTYTAGANNYTALPGTNGTNKLEALRGYRVFVFGDRFANLSLPNNTGVGTSNINMNSATTLKAKGTLITGQVTYNSTGATANGSTDNTITLATVPGQYSLVANPYWSPVDYSTLTRSDIASTYWIWDQAIGNRGAYISYNNASGSSGGNITKDIQPGQAIFVQSTGSNPSLVFNEANKSSVFTNTFRAATEEPSKMMVKLFTNTSLSNGGNMQDGVAIAFRDDFITAIGEEDAPKFANTDENIAIIRNQKLLNIEGRPTVTASDTIPLRIWKLFTNNSYTIQLQGFNFDAGVSCLLVDKYLNQQYPVSVVNKTEIPFSFTADSASYYERFMLVFKPVTTLPVNITSIKAFYKNSGVQVEWNAISEINIDGYDVEKSEDGIHFNKGVFVKANGLANYHWLDVAPYFGNNYYRIKMIGKTGQVSYTHIVSVKPDGIKINQIYVSNPVLNNMLSMQFENVDKGRYHVALYNQLGQAVHRNTINHSGGSASLSVWFSQIAGGMYRLRISDGKNEAVFNENVLVR